MAIDLCSESSSATMSPRISFSYDLSQKDVIPVDQHIFRSSSSSSSTDIDFDFCVLESFEVESSTADELFFDGKILPIQIKRKLVPLKPIRQSIHPPPRLPLSPPPRLPPLKAEDHRPESSKIEISKESKITNSESDEKQSSKSFWRFKRSSSLNCGNGYASTLCPLPLLSRSNSTGSAANVKRSSLPKNQSGGGSMKQSPGVCQKPPLKKNFSSYGNGVRINPVLNVPSTNLFGFGNMFSNSKDRNKRK